MRPASGQEAPRGSPAEAIGRFPAYDPMRSYALTMTGGGDVEARSKSNGGLDLAMLLSN